MNDTAASILIIDDEPANVTLLEKMLKGAGYSNVSGTTDPQRGLGMFGDLAPDLLLLDLHMPVLDGFAILNAIDKMRATDEYKPVLVLTADATDGARERALVSGAMDFVTKPFNITEVLLRIKNLLSTRQLHVRLKSANVDLARDALDAQLDTARRLTIAAETRDDETGAHIERVGTLSGALARSLGFTETEAEILETAAMLHDVGKIGVPDSVLLKPGALTQEEFEVMRAHTIIGAGILSSSTSPVLSVAAAVAISHHERWDGNGYPHGLARKDIPFAGRIVAVADAFDAMTNDRRYRAARAPQEAIDVILREAGAQFDPLVARALAEITPTELQSSHVLHGERRSA